MESKAYDVVLVPDATLTEKTLELSKELETKGTYFTLGRQNFFSHLSLYMLQLNEADLAEALKRLSSVSNTTNKINTRASQYHYTHDYLDVEYEKSAELSVLQKKVIHELNTLRDGLRENDQARLATSSGEELSNILEYGYRSVGNLFRPHLTFTRFTNDQKSILPSLPSKETFNGVYDSIGIFEMGDNGTCVRLVEAWNLQPTDTQY